MPAGPLPPVEPEEILADLLGLDPGLRRKAYYGERSLYTPSGKAPFGTIFASIKDRDGPNDKAANLSRPGVYRFAFYMPGEVYTARFGPTPRRSPKGGVVDIVGHDPARIGELTPHPVYAWMRWVQILSPTSAQYDELRPLLMASLEIVKSKWHEKRAG